VPRPEEVLLIRPRNLREAAFVAYQIGNRHLPLDIAVDGLKTPHQPVAEATSASRRLRLNACSAIYPVSATAGHTYSMARGIGTGIAERLHPCRKLV
jgi:urease accessory protein UreE